MRNLICAFVVFASIALLAETAFADYGYHYNRRGTGYWRDDSNDGYEYNNANSLGMNRRRSSSSLSSTLDKF